MAADGYVQTQPDSTGKKVDAEQVSTSSGTAERLRVAIPDGVDVTSDVLSLILREMQITNAILAQAFGLSKNLEHFKEIENA
jgi:hypothetical protein